MDSLHTQMEFIESFEDLIDLEIIEPSIGDDSCINFEQYFDNFPSVINGSVVSVLSILHFPKYFESPQTKF